MKKGLVLGAITLITAVALFAFGHKAFADQRDFRVHNSSRVTIVRLYVSPTDTDSWESEVLKGDMIVPGDYTDITFTRFDDMGACVFDIRADGIDGSHGYFWGINLCRTSSVTFR